MTTRFKECVRCRGDLGLDEGEWRCWQCARYQYTEAEKLQIMQEARSVPDLSSEDASGETRPRRRSSQWAARDISVTIEAKARAEKRWWDNHREIIEHLDKDKQVKQIALLTGKSERQIRAIQDQFNDLRAASGTSAVP